MVDGGWKIWRMWLIEHRLFLQVIEIQQFQPDNKWPNIVKKQNYDQAGTYAKM